MNARLDVQNSSLRDLVSALQQAAERGGCSFGAVVAYHAREVLERRRIDLQLLTLLSLRPSLRSDALIIPPDTLIRNIVDQLRKDDLTCSILRVMATSSDRCLDGFRRGASSVRLLELMDVLAQHSDRLRIIRRHGRTVRSTPQDIVLGTVCLSYVQLSLRPSEPGAVSRIALKSLDELLRQIEVLNTLVPIGVQGYAIRKNGALRFFNIAEDATWPFSVDPVQHTVAVLRSIHGILSHFLIDDLFVDDEYSSRGIYDILTRARDAQRRCWRTFRQLRRDFGSLDRGFESESEFAWLEVAALAQLAQLERMCRRHSVAVRLAIGSIKQALVLGGVRASEGLFNSLKFYLLNQGIDVPRMDANRQAVSRLPPDAPSLALRAGLEDDWAIKKAVAILKDNGFTPVGWGIRVCLYIRENVSNPEVRAAAFMIMVRMGALAEVRQFFHLSKEEERDRPRKEFLHGARAATANCLDADGVLAWANAIAVVSQSAVFWLNDDRHNSVKAGLRKLLRELVWTNRPLSVMERLFVNHVQVGLSYHAAMEHRSRYARDVQSSDDSEVAVIDSMLDATDSGRLRSINAQDFRDATFSIGDDEVMVSVTTDDGGSLKLMLLGPSGPWYERPKKCSIDEDWVGLLRNFAGKAAIQLGYMVDHPDLARLDIPDQLISLCSGILKSALRLNPNVRRIMVHADPMWHVVPWQFILHSHLEDVLGKWLERLISQRRRREHLREFGKIVFWRVPGVQLSQRNPRTAFGPRRIDIETRDRNFSTIKSRLEKNRTASGRGILSIMAHGKVGSTRVDFRIHGEQVSDIALAEYGAYPLVLLHVCYAAVVKDLHKANDISGAPSEILQGGAWVVVAPGLPMPTSQFEKLEQYFYNLDAVSDDLQDIETRYLSACVESPLVALYTLYSAAIAPRLN